MVPSTIRTTAVRTSRRLFLVDSELLQGDMVVARAHILFLKTSKNPVGRIWEPYCHPVAPSAGIPADEEGRLYRSGGGPWTSSAAEHNNEQLKSVWQEPRPIVHGEMPTAFQSAASTADLTSLVVHWGDRGVEFINADVALALSRLPVGPGIGVSVNHRSANEGISAGTSVLFDREGAFGTASVVGLANADNPVTVGHR
jgi:hypothetical protein